MNLSIETIARQILNRIDAGRKLKAQCGLDDDTLRVNIVALESERCDVTVVSGLNTYEVSINDYEPRCTCGDYLNRREVCKHIAAGCFYLLGTTTPSAPETFTCGEKVQLRGLSDYTGKVVCVCQDIISVHWPAQGFRTAKTWPYRSVELERARP